MKTRIAVLADHASLSIDHKLNIMGIFTALHAPQAPVVHPQMKLVTQFEFDASEAGQRPLRVTLIDADGRELFGIGATVTIQATHNGHPALLNQIVDLSQLAFPAFGDYEFRILIDDEIVAEIPLIVAPIKPPAQPQN